MRIPYGYAKLESGQVIIDPHHSNVVKTIYDLYLQGKSLGGIADTLKAQKIPSPTENLIWTRTAIDKVLSNGRYIPDIIPEEQFWKGQLERERRTYMNNNGRKIARYNSQNVLSGLLVCGECGGNYRRITRLSGEVVWRCADKVENGKQATCTNTITVSDDKIKKVICDQLDMEYFDEDVVNEMVNTVIIGKEEFSLKMKTPLTFELRIS